MIKNTKGLSTVVATLIMILIVLVAVGVVWAVFKNLTENVEESSGTSLDCGFIDLEIVTDNLIGCAGGCNVAIKRTGGPDFDGLRVVITDGINSESVDSSTIPGVAETETYNISPGLSDPTEASVVAYFIDSNGENQYCSNIVTKAV